MRLILLIFISILVFGCNNKSEKVPQDDRQVKIPSFNADSAYTYIAKQLDFGPRRMNSQAHEECKNWLAQKLGEHGFDVELQEFEAMAYNNELLKATNIHGIYNPEVEERVLLCAHYDTRHIADKDDQREEEPIDGADDGASGVAVLIEMARLINEANIPMGIDIVFFDAEDHGSDKPNQDYTWGLGSQYWAKEIRKSDYKYKYGILLDMVGAKNATFRKEGFSMASAKHEVDQIWNLAKQMGKDRYFVDSKTGYITDDHRFIIENARIPMVDIINIQQNGAFGFYHHRHSDNIDVIDLQTLAAVGQVVTAYVFRESNKQNK